MVTRIKKKFRDAKIKAAYESMPGYTLKELSGMFKVSISTVHYAIHGRKKKQMFTFILKLLRLRVCVNCYHYNKGLCNCRELSDMITKTNKCPDWWKNETR